MLSGRNLSDFVDSKHCQLSLTFLEPFKGTPAIMCVCDSPVYTVGVPYGQVNNTGATVKVYNADGTFSQANRAWVYWTALEKE